MDAKTVMSLRDRKSKGDPTPNRGSAQAVSSGASISANWR